MWHDEARTYLSAGRGRSGCRIQQRSPNVGAQHNLSAWTVHHTDAPRPLVMFPSMFLAPRVNAVLSYTPPMSGSRSRCLNSSLQMGSVTLCAECVAHPGPSRRPRPGQ